ncbi:MAG: formate dehydrogenase subunit gamma [Gammaproteobacteria bacterium]|nr:formate dehydrogenase subunit gamma [Gammaproteobacteria bacterium]MDH5592067.1 formate dehydrogenase subunit gamma [Gammaproteobacteria bacterium]
MTASSSINKRKKMMFWTGLIMLLAIFLLPMTGYISTGFATADQEVQQTNPRADYWRLVRDNSEGYSAVTGRETNELIQSSGQNWRQLRNGPIATFGSWILGFTLAVLALFYIWRGQVPLTHPRTGQTVERWTLNERRIHWVTAGLFLVLAITGLSLLYGRAVLIPLFGHHGFSAYAELAKLAHNILGPVFMIGLLSMLVHWFKQNFFSKVDLDWFKAFGGMIGDNHPSAGKLNGGEKLWFWSLATAGIALCLSGLVLDFPNFDQEREIIQISHLIHVITALALIAFAFGHIYIGTVGTEGALEGMVTGQVDTAWAQQHHDLWLQELQQQKPKSD